MIGRRQLDLDELTRTYISGMRVWLGERLPTFFKVAKTAKLPEEFKAQINSIQRKNREASKILELFMTGTPDAKQIARSKIVFESLRIDLYNFFKDIRSVPFIAEGIDRKIGGLKQFSGQLFSAFDIFNEHIKILHEIGLKWHRPWFRETKGVVKGFYKGLAHPQFQSPYAQLGFDAGLIALAGPLAPILSPVIGGIAGGFRAIKQQRMMKQMQRMTAPLAAEAMGTGGARMGFETGRRAYGTDIRRFGGAVPAQENQLIAFYKRLTRQGRPTQVITQSVDTQSRLFSNQVMAPSVGAALFEFFNKTWIKARWTREVLKALKGQEIATPKEEKKKGFLEQLRGAFKGIGDFLKNPLAWLGLAGIFDMFKARFLSILGFFTKTLFGKIVAVVGAAIAGWQIGRWLGTHVKWGGKTLDEHVQTLFNKIGSIFTDITGKISDMFMGQRYKGITAPQAISKRVGELSRRSAYAKMTTPEIIKIAATQLAEKGIITPEDATKYGLKTAWAMEARARGVVGKTTEIPKLEAEAEAAKTESMEGKLAQNLEKNSKDLTSTLTRLFEKQQSTVMQTIGYGSSDPYSDELNQNGVGERR